MLTNIIRNRINALLKKEEVKEVIEEPKEEVTNKTSSKNVYVYQKGKCIGIYDSITKCGIALGMSRLMVRKAIENDVEMDNGMTLSFNKK